GGKAAELLANEVQRLVTEGFIDDGALGDMDNQCPARRWRIAMIEEPRHMFVSAKTARSLANAEIGRPHHLVLAHRDRRHELRQRLAESDAGHQPLRLPEPSRPGKLRRPLAGTGKRLAQGRNKGKAVQGPLLA